MAWDNARELRTLIDAELPALRAFAGTAPATLREGAWSPKEELGHLIDSACNNYMRFVRAALEPSFSGPQYDQEGWVRLHGYRDAPWSALVDFLVRLQLSHRAVGGADSRRPPHGAVHHRLEPASHAALPD